jgi:RecA/RadA recombinase
MQLQDFTIVCGPSGSGKTLMAYDYALNAVREGRTVRVADVGGSYAKLAEVVGGTMLRVNSNGFNSQVFGDVPLTVADFEGAKAAGAAALDAGSFPFVTNAGAGEVWIVDETETLPLSVKELRLILERHLAAGGSVLVTIQQSPESALAQALAEIPTSSNVRRAMVTLSRFQPMR